MNIRLFDLLLGLFIGFYMTPTIVIAGFTIHWVLVGLVATVLWSVAKKLGRFLWKKLVAEMKKEMIKELDKK